MIFELGGPRVYSYEEILRAVAHQAGIAPLLIPIPFAVWHALTWTFEILPNPLLTRNQVELARTWRHIEEALKLMRGPHQS